MDKHYVVVTYPNGRRWTGHYIGDINSFIDYVGLLHGCTIQSVPFVHFPDK